MGIATVNLIRYRTFQEVISTLHFILKQNLLLTHQRNEHYEFFRVDQLLHHVGVQN